jgi:uncharacterized protein Veg
MKIFGTERGRGRKLHNKKLQSVYPSLHIIRVIKSKYSRWENYVALMERVKTAYGNFI